MEPPPAGQGQRQDQVMKGLGQGGAGSPLASSKGHGIRAPPPPGWAGS